MNVSCKNVPCLRLFVSGEWRRKVAEGRTWKWLSSPPASTIVNCHGLQLPPTTTFWSTLGNAINMRRSTYVLASASRGDLGYHYCHHPASRALSTAKTRATRAHLGGNCGLLLCRCHLHDRKLVPEATITTNPVTDLGFATVTICPLPKESQTQQLTICYRRVCKKSKEILWTMNVKCVKVWIFVY